MPIVTKGFGEAIITKGLAHHFGTNIVKMIKKFMVPTISFVLRKNKTEKNWRDKTWQNMK